MRRTLVFLHAHRILAAQCVLIAVIALATAWTWLHATGQPALTRASVVACTAISVALALVVDAAARRVVRGRPRRAHARTNTITPRKDTTEG
jgi:cytochrome bd-type quinol oxidase subunit 1